jgi:hypothetical protein
MARNGFGEEIILHYYYHDLFLYDSYISSLIIINFSHGCMALFSTLKLLFLNTCTSPTHGLETLFLVDDKACLRRASEGHLQHIVPMA